MDNKIKTNALIKALLMFLLTFAIIVATAFIKYRAYGSFDNEERRSTLYIACAATAISVLLILVALFTYLVYSRQHLVERSKTLAAICTAIIVSCVASIALSALPGGLFYMPVSLVAFILVPLCARRDVFISGIVTNLIASVILLFESILGNKVEALSVVVMLIMGFFLTSIVAYTMSNVTRRIIYTLRGLVIGAVSVGLLFIASLIIPSIDFIANIGYICIAVFGQVLVGLMLQSVFEWVFNIITNTKLTELTDHNSPLMKKLINEALGTFNHSLEVAGFAEVCAQRIGENPYLAKACAYYHDVGKTSNPTFFVENQSGYNPHDELLPEVSARILRAHTTDGYRLCLEHRIPEEVAEVTLQHHGTLPMAVFYAKAQKLTDSEVNIKEYSYDGKTPETKIAAIIMICDAAEAALRAKGNPTGAEVEELVSAIINDRIARGQFDNCDITMRDLNIIKATIMEMYGGVYHARLQYPSGKANKR